MNLYCWCFDLWSFDELFGVAVQTGIASAANKVIAVTHVNVLYLILPPMISVGMGLNQPGQTWLMSGSAPARFEYYFRRQVPKPRFQPNRARIRAAISLGVRPLSTARL